MRMRSDLYKRPKTLKGRATSTVVGRVGGKVENVAAHTMMGGVGGWRSRKAAKKTFNL